MYRNLVVVFLFILTISGCSQGGYYLQAAKGQLSLLSKRQSVAKILDDPNTPVTLRAKLALAVEARQFAIDQLGFDGNPGYTHYVDTGRRYVVWNVVAAPEFSIAPKTWCFPIAGCVSYKGFFTEQGAVRAQKALELQGYDTLVYGVGAYSTLGWFNDPLLNTFIHYNDSDLAALLFHEISHQLVYVQDDSDFNEAFATAVELELLERWLQTRGDADEIDSVRENQIRQGEIAAMILRYRDELAIAYKSNDRDAEKTRLFAELKQQYEKIRQQGRGTAYYDWWFSRPLNNADLLTTATYYRLVPAFESMIAKNQGELSSFFARVRALAALDKTSRDAELARYSDQ